MKVRHFRYEDGYGDSLVSQISKWLEGKEIEIISCNYSTVYRSNGVEYSCLLFYK